MQDELQTAIDSYEPSSETVALVRETPILLLVGIAGAGKDTIKHRLMERGAYHHIISHTTRQPRENVGVMEQDGVEYHFIDQATALDMVRAGAFVEAKFVHGNVYGTSAAEIERAYTAGLIALADIDVQGVVEYKAISENVIALYILPPTFEEWLRRLYARYGEAGADEADIRQRMHIAIEELEEALRQPYYHFIINDNLDHTVEIADEIAHNHDRFNDIDADVRNKAVQLLEDLRAHVASITMSK
jgi:guanylate kinase